MSEFAYAQAALDRLVLEKTAESVGYKLVKVRGIPQNPTFDVATFEDIIDNFVTRDGDVFISTFVKAGTTWTQQIIHQLLRQGAPGGFYGETVPWLEAVSSEFLGSREAPTWDYAKINAAPSPRYFKTHATVAHLPRGKAPGLKVIYVARNPKDSVVSLFHHASSKPEFGYKGDFNTFCEMFLTGQAENGDWFDHVLDWHKQCLAHPDTHLFLKYEDMYQDTPGAVKQIAQFLGLPCADDVLPTIVKNSTLTEMQKTSSFGLNHLRKGGYGGWRSTFTVAMSEFFDDVYRHRMHGSGLTFNFGPDARGKDVIM